MVTTATAQSANNDSLSRAAESNYIQTHKRIHAKVLSSWAALNLVGGGAAMFFSQGEAHHFHHMNAAWGSINLLIGSYMWHKANHVPVSIPVRTPFQERKQFKRFLLINIGLDLAYMAAGLALNNQATGQSGALYHGFGKAVILQGGTLVMLDLSSLIVLTAHERRVRKRQKLPL